MTDTQNKKDKIVKNRVKRKASLRYFMSVVVIVAVGVLGYKLWENPRILHQMKELWEKDANMAEVYQKQVDILQNRLIAVEAQLADINNKVENPDFSAIQEKLDNIEQINVNTIKSKADVDAVLGLVMRMDKAEEKIDELAEVTDKSALVLTATMLVKDAAEKGGKFVYEAEVLNEIASGNYKIEKEISIINEASLKGIKSNIELQRMFADIFADKYSETDVENDDSSLNWKERIYQQVSKVVKINKTNEVVNEPVFSEEDRAWAVINDFVARGDIKKAVAIAKKPLNEDLLKNVQFNEWLQEADDFVVFYDAISRISANALAIMKVKFLQAE